MSFDGSRYNKVYTPAELTSLQAAYDACVENLNISETDEDTKLALAKRIMSESKKNNGCEPEELVRIITGFYDDDK